MSFRKIYNISTNTVGLAVRSAFFAVVIFVFYIVYKLLFHQALDGSQQIYPLLALWVLSAYVVLPRIHRILSKYYLPNYYVGRIRSPSGFLSDPVNIALFADAKSIHKAMKRAGWVKSDKLTPKTLIKVAFCSVFHKSYPSAPVGDMFLFNRRYDFAYQQEVNGSPNERHHVRFWKTSKGWRLPGGRDVDWLAAASYDTHVGVKIATGQLDHFIHENIDEERDYLLNTLKETKLVKEVEIVKHFTDAYHDRNNGGDRIKTDGSLPFISL